MCKVNLSCQLVGLRQIRSKCETRFLSFLLFTPGQGYKKDNKDSRQKVGDQVQKSLSYKIIPVVRSRTASTTRVPVPAFLSREISATASGSLRDIHTGNSPGVKNHNGGAGGF